MEREKDKILSSDTRKEILINLRQRNKTLSELSREIGVSKPAILKHLFLLSSIEAVRRIKNGNRFIYYKITEKGKRMADLIASLIAAFLGSAIIQRFLQRKEIEFISEKIPSEGLPRAPVPEEVPKISEISTPPPSSSPAPTPFPEAGLRYFPALKIEVIAGFVLIFLCVFIALRVLRRRRR